MVHDNGNGIITGDPDEPLYGRTYLPRKFKIAVTVPGDNSMDIYINDIGPPLHPKRILNPKP